MASIFKRKGGKKWMISYTDENRKRKTVTGATDKEATKQIAAKLEADVQLKRRGVIDASVERYAEAEHRSLIVRGAEDKIIGGHLAEFHAALLAKGATSKHAHMVRAHVARIIDACNAERISDLTASVVQRAIDDLRKPKGEKKPGLSLQTCNHALRAIKQFSRWLWKDRRTREDALAHLDGYNVRTDRRHERRALTDEEFSRLLAAAENGPVLFRMTGSDRWYLYQLAAGTGFRVGELRSLTPGSFDLDADPPTVTVEAAYSKHRRRDEQPIRRDLAEVLRPWLAGKASGKPTLAIPDKPVKALQKDLAAAGIPYRDGADRVFDFHALRGQFITSLVRGKATVKEAQELARHSSPTLTMNHYTHLTIRDKTRALESLPPVSRSGSDKQAAQATGTYDDRPRANRRAAHAQRAAGTKADKGEQSGTPAGRKGSGANPCRDKKSPVSKGKKETRATGLEPVTFGSVDRCSIH